jgi:hypothetical protein
MTSGVGTFQEITIVRFRAEDRDIHAER